MNSYFVLIVPLSGLLQAVVLIVSFAAMRRHGYLLWVAAAYIFSAIPLAAQSLMNNAQLANWAVVTSMFYLAGIWCAVKGVASKSAVPSRPKSALFIVAVTLGLMFYFSIVSDNLWKRMVILNTALFILTALPLKDILRQKLPPSMIERLLRISFVILVLFAFFRAVMISTLMGPEITVQFSHSLYWLMLMASSMLISLLFTFVLLACAVKDTILMLEFERNQDSLTQLLTRRAFFELAEVSLKSTSNGQWAIIMCDIDHFKRVNDTWGHAAGDLVLKMVGQSLLNQSRQGDLVTRFGGEEFVVLIKCRDLSAASMVAQRMRMDIAQTHFPEVPVALTASFGVAIVEDGKLAEAISQSDILLYQAKNAGRNQVATEIITPDSEEIGNAYMDDPVA